MTLVNSVVFVTPPDVGEDVTFFTSSPLIQRERQLASQLTLFSFCLPSQSALCSSSSMSRLPSGYLTIAFTSARDVRRRTPRHNRTQCKRPSSPPIPPLRFLFHSKPPDLPLYVFFLPAETMQHSQLEEISISEPFNALHPISPDWVSFSSKAGSFFFRTHETQKFEKRQPVVSILSFVFVVCL
jgi:hypothetical protein